MEVSGLLAFKRGIACWILSLCGLTTTCERHPASACGLWEAKVISSGRPPLDGEP